MPDVTINDQVITRKTSLRYLGLIFDQTLSGREHILFKEYCACFLTCSYCLNLITGSELTQLTGLDVIQNEGMRAILGCTKVKAAVAI